ncbi:hypothetical protein ARMGADRAFT_1040999, partial [Armillaria gallica]
MMSDDGYSDSNSNGGYSNSNSSYNSGSSYDSNSGYDSNLSYGSLPCHKCRLPQKRARWRAAQPAHSHHFPMTSVPPTHSQPRSIPSLWTKLELENRSPEFPDIYTAPSHSKVPEGHGTIYIVIASINPADLHHMFTHGAKFSSFCGLDEAAAKGMPALRPSLNDFLVFHDKYRKEEDGDSKDIVKSWSRS